MLAAAAVAACGALAPRGASEPAVTAASNVAAPETVAAGAQLARAYCTQCHAVGRTGESPNADAPALRRLHERYPDALLADAFPQRMRVGHPAMPEFRFTDDELDALLGYLVSIQEVRGA